MKAHDLFSIMPIVAGQVHTNGNPIRLDICQVPGDYALVGGSWITAFRYQQEPLGRAASLAVFQQERPEVGGGVGNDEHFQWIGRDDVVLFRVDERHFRMWISCRTSPVG